MFVACWKYEPTTKTWQNTGDSINLDLVDKIELYEPPRTDSPHLFNVVAWISGRNHRLISGAPSRDEALDLVGRMLANTGVGYWPTADTLTAPEGPHFDPPGRN